MPLKQGFARPLVVSLAVLGWLAGPAWALIDYPYPLLDMLRQSEYVFLAQVEAVDPNRPSMMLAATGNLKGEAPWKSLPVNLTGDSLKHTPEFLKRVKPELPVVLFAIKKEDGGLMVLGYTNGTWFQVLGTADGDDVRWAFQHCEIYLRRTFKGTTAELEKAVAGVMAGKARPPKPNEKEPPGFGPEVE